MEDSKLYTILQISDSAFPTGGFSHSLGSEAAVQTLYVKNLDTLKIFLLSCLENTGSSCLPFVRAVYECNGDGQEIIQLDSLCNSLMLDHVSHRASTMQGKSFLSTSSEVFCHPLIAQIRDHVEEERMQGHLAVVFSAVGFAMGVQLHPLAQTFLFSALRTAIASLVRLGKIGTVQAQRLQFELQGCLDDIISRSWSILPEDSCITFPVLEVLQNSHDTLFSKMFYS